MRFKSFVLIAGLLVSGQAAAQISVVTTVASSSNNSITLVLPATPAAGDLLIAQVATNQPAATITPNAAWTTLRTDDGSAGAIRVVIYYRVFQAGDPTTYIFSVTGGSGSRKVTGGITVFRNVDTTASPFLTTTNVVSSSPSPTNIITAPALGTTVPAGTMLLQLFATAGEATLTPPGSPYTTQYNITNPSGGAGHPSLAATTRGPLGASESPPAITATASTSAYNTIGHHLALRPIILLNHIRIEHTGIGLTCEPAAMTVKACSDAACSSLYTGSVTTTLSPTGWVGGDTINFSGGSTAAQLRRTTLGTVTLGAGTTTPAPAVATRCFNGATETCSFEFKNTGFIFSAIPTQIAATTSATHTLQAVRTDNSTGVCTGLFTGNVPNIELASECINPATCQAGQQVTFNNNGSGTIAANNGGAVSSWTTRTLTFGANSTANFTFSYPDVGAIRLHARYNIAGSGNYMTGATTPAGGFVVRPAGFTVTGIQRTADAFANPAAANAAGTVFIKAGDPMTLTVTAVNSAGVKTPSYGKESPPEGVLLTSALVAGLGLTNNPALGNGTIAGGAFGTGVNAGIATVTNVSWGEVGIIRITPSVGDGSYLGTGDVTGTTTGNIGRFTPHNFNVTPVAPLFTTSCTAGSFTYVGQPFSYAGGLAPVLTVTARNLAGGTTLNYKGTSPAAQAFFKITNTKLAQAPYAAQSDRYTRFDALGGGTTPTLDVTGLPATGADPAIVDNANGTATLTFGSGTGLAFARSTPVAPFNADIALAINVIDTDDVAFAANPARFGTATAGNGMAFSAGKDMRFGRLRLGSASGSQLLPLRVPMEAQYWNGTFFITNVADSCTTLVSNNVGIGNVIGGVSTSVSAVTSPLSAGRGAITLAKPTPAASGSVDVAVNLGTGANADACPAFTPATAAFGNRAYLRGNWCNPPGTSTKDPAARARFGIRAGSDETIYMRENY